MACRIHPDHGPQPPIVDQQQLHLPRPRPRLNSWPVPCWNIFLIGLLLLIGVAALTFSIVDMATWKKPKFTMERLTVEFFHLSSSSMQLTAAWNITLIGTNRNWYGLYLGYFNVKVVYEGEVLAMAKRIRQVVIPRKNAKEINVEANAIDKSLTPEVYGRLVEELRMRAGQVTLQVVLSYGIGDNYGDHWLPPMRVAVRKELGPSAIPPVPAAH